MDRTHYIAAYRVAVQAGDTKLMDSLNRTYMAHKRAVIKCRNKARTVSGETTAVVLGKECLYCGGDYDVNDHFFPLYTHLNNDPLNLVPCCNACNSSKSDRDPGEWMESRIEKLTPKARLALTMLKVRRTKFEEMFEKQ